MKKCLLFAAATLAGLASCSQNEIENINNPQDNAIRFGTYLGQSATTKGSVITVDGLKGTDKGFGVFAFYTANDTWNAYSSKTTPNFMNNQQVTTTDGSTWTYSPLKYWPNNTNDKVSFFAYAPYDQSKQWDNDQKIAFEVKQDLTEQTDLLFSAGAIDQTKQKLSEKVSFTFKHALSKIDLNIAYAADVQNTAESLPEIDRDTKITVSEVKIGDNSFYPKGNLLMTAASAADAWTPDDSSTKLDFTLSGENLNVTNVTNEYQKLNKDNACLMIIPQDFTTTGFPVKVTYTVTTSDDKLTGGKSEVTNTITNTAKIKFEAGKQYKLNLVLGMTSVKLNATVDNWESGTTTTEIDLPANATASISGI